MKSSKNFYVKGDLSYVPLDEALEKYNFSSLVDNSIEELENRKENTEFLEKVDIIAEKYLNVKELCIYNLVVHSKKRTSDITVILNYNSWRATQNAIERTFKIVKLYMEYEEINKDLLKYEIDRNFSKFENRVIGYIENRMTIHQINKKLGKKYHYSKTHSLVNNILSRLADSGGVCRQYYNFLIEIRKFKNSCNFDEYDRIRVLNKNGGN